MEQFQFPFLHSTKSLLTEPVQALIGAAEAAAAKAYAPYSTFRVGAAALMTDGTLHTGWNQENAAFPEGCCAERSVLTNVDMTDKANLVKAVAVSYIGNKEAANPLAPCGLCRQAILEVQQWQGAPITIYMCSPDGQVIMVEDAAYLLPFAFGSGYLSAPATQSGDL